MLWRFAGGGRGFFALFVSFACFAVPVQAQTFTDVGATAGVADTAGSAVYAYVAWGDYNNDGLLDLCVTNWGRFAKGFVTKEGYVVADTLIAVPTRLYRNNGNGTFTDVAAGAGTGDTGTWVGSPRWGDYDNDGDLDLFVGKPNASNLLFQNSGNGAFTNVAAGAGIALQGDSGSWVDYNNDGWLDLCVGLMPATDAQGTPILTSPSSRLFRNNGDGTFTDVAASVGVNQFSNNPVWGDYDNDGDQDLFMATHASPNPKQHPNHLFRNNGDGTFTDVAASAGVVNPNETLSVSGAWGDYDNDGDLDLYVINNDGINQLFRNNGNGTFTDVAASAGVGDSKTGFGNGAIWGDFDNDGFLDLYVVNIASSSPNRLFHNNGNGTFTEVGASAGVNNQDGTGVACGDYDNDGDLDIYLAYARIGADGLPTGGPNRLYRNNGTANRWLVVKLTGTKSNRDGIGARVTAVTGRGRFRRDVEGGGSGWGSQPSLPVEFGLGSATVVDTLIIRWPSGVVDVLTNVSSNRILQVTEGMSRLLAGPVPRHRAVTIATVTQDGAPAAGLEVGFSRSISGRAPDYRWKGTTDSRGQAVIQIALEPGRDVSGYYCAEAINPVSRAEVGEWMSIPINGGKEITLSLTVGRKARITAEIPLPPDGPVRAKPAVADASADAPVEFGLQPNFPNPFNPATTIRYALAEASGVRLTIYNVLGQEVRTLVNAAQGPGFYSVVWDGQDAFGRPAASGIYLYRLEAGPHVAVQKMILAR